VFEVLVCDIDKWEVNHYRGSGILLILEDVDLLIRLLLQAGKISIGKGDVTVFTVGSRLLQDLME